MGRTHRKKKHTQPTALPTSEGAAPPPKTFVMERGKVGNTLNHLILNLRQVMEPNTATRLKVRQRNVLKDFVQVAGPLGVTHFIIVSKSEEFINLRVCRLPRGPTLTFHIQAFSLSKDVMSSQKDPVSTHHIYMTPPLLVQTGFSDDKSSRLMSTMFQNILPSINVQSVKLADIRRCLLLHYTPDSNTLEFRHYAIRVKPRGLSRGVRKLGKSRVPDLSKLSDISEYILGDGASDSEGEEMGGVGDVTLPQDLPGRGNTQSQQSVVRLSELGPRMTLQLVKIEAGLCGGEVLYHSFVQKSRSAVRTLRCQKEEQRRLKVERKREQEMNVARKKVERERHKERCLAGMSRESEGESGEEEDDDVEWFRQEVGEEPDPDMFVTSDKTTQGRLHSKLKRRMDKWQRSKDTSPPKPKRAKHTEGVAKPQRRGTKSERSKPAKAKPMVRFVKGGQRTGTSGRGSGRGNGRGGGVKAGSRSGGRVFRKKAGRT